MHYLVFMYSINISFVPSLIAAVFFSLFFLLSFPFPGVAFFLDRFVLSTK
jgi:hypothetical protein